jgi:hypothetical protein
MARSTRATKAAKVAPAPEKEEVAEGGVTRGPTEMHEIFSEWLEEETGVRVSPEHIFLVTSKRTAFRKSDAYQNYAEGKDAQRAEAKAERDERKKARAAEAEVEDDEPKPKRRGRGRAVTEEIGEETPTPARRGRRVAAKATEDDEEETTTRPGRRTGTRRARAAAVATEPDF